MLKKSIPLSILALALLAAGCVQPKLDREQFVALDNLTRAAMTRTYKGFTQEQLIAAAEKALLHSEKDYNITSQRKDGFTATRLWSVYMVLSAVVGYDSWNIQVDGQKVKIAAWYAGGGQIFTPGLASKSQEEYYLSPPLYDLFFDRMEYFLGLRSDWAPCAKVDKTKYYWTAGLENGNNPLCFMANPQDPTKAKAVKYGGD